jgi:succinate dehydrogenase flavin-adding protein (antitoxin of CptAB toxin-antitoxin module)
MITQLVMREHNKQFYKDLIEDMKAHENGLFTFILQVSAGDIVNYVAMDNLPPNSFNEPTTNPINGTA